MSVGVDEEPQLERIEQIQTDIWNKIKKESKSNDAAHTVEENFVLLHQSKII